MDFSRSSGHPGAVTTASDRPGGGPRVLVVEDDERMLDLLARALRSRGYVVDLAADGEAAERVGLANEYDAVVLDVMIPPPDGIAVLRSWRTAQRMMPVLLLTARDGVDDRVTGLDTGADDYLTKPFAVAELFARVERLLDRPALLRPTVLRNGDLTLDPATHRVARGETLIDLSAKELALLQELMRQPGKVLSRSYLLDHLWDSSYEGDSNVVDVYIGYLREKIDRPFRHDSIETVRGVGYRLRRPDNQGSQP